MKKTVRDYIRTIADFPHEGILFRDVTTLFADARGFRMAIDQLFHPHAGQRIDKVVGLEARGFILGGAIAHQLSVGFVPIRKKGKLPGQTVSQAYKLEYGEAIMEIHEDALQPGEKVSMTYWQPAAPARLASSWLNASAPRSSAAPLSWTCPNSAAARFSKNLGCRCMSCASSREPRPSAPPPDS